MLPGTACPLTSLKAFFHYLFVLQIPLFSPILFLQAVAAAKYMRRDDLRMKSDEVCEMLDTLYLELINEIDNHCDGFLDASGECLANAIKGAVKTTREKLYGPMA